MTHDCSDFWDEWLSWLQQQNVDPEMEDALFNAWRAGWLARGEYPDVRVPDRHEQTGE